MNVNEAAQAVRAGDRRALAKAITLIESTREEDAEAAASLLELLAPQGGGALRIAISGPPGAGKSTLIETLGLLLVARGHRPAVLAIDPSSRLTGGSLMGDKTRMQRLSVHGDAFVRPSPTSGLLGGVASRTREVILLCEAAGHDVVLIETVGVGQSEAVAASMTDLFVLLQLPNSGDELQAMKRGILEVADLVLVNKADLDRAAADVARVQLAGALKRAGERQRRTPAVLGISAQSGEGVEAAWAGIEELANLRRASGEFAAHRARQHEDWLWESIGNRLLSRFRQHPDIVGNLPRLLEAVSASQLLPGRAARELVALFEARSRST